VSGVVPVDSVTGALTVLRSSSFHIGEDVTLFKQDFNTCF
jgi:hypothetical protein